MNYYNKYYYTYKLFQKYNVIICNFTELNPVKHYRI